MGKKWGERVSQQGRERERARVSGVGIRIYETKSSDSRTVTVINYRLETTVNKRAQTCTHTHSDKHTHTHTHTYTHRQTQFLLEFLRSLLLTPYARGGPSIQQVQLILKVHHKEVTFFLFLVYGCKIRRLPLRYRGILQREQKTQKRS